MCFIVALVIVPLSSMQIGKWSKEIHDLRVAKVHGEKLIQEFEKQLNLYRAGFEEKMIKLHSVRPSEDQLISFLKTMDAMARQSEVRGFELTSLQSATAEKQVFPTLRYSAKFEATPDKFKQFLTAFDDLPYYLEIVDFGLQSKDEDTPLSEIAEIGVTFNLFTR